MYQPYTEALWVGTKKRLTTSLKTGALSMDASSCSWLMCVSGSMAFSDSMPRANSCPASLPSFSPAVSVKSWRPSRE
ncbi:hypothetical protein EYF80_024876 [Liparis tanakae]|uniref:Uncharacterized protein n=1 Tax=Liparis tanakae TaxID=230148 RepID=A0A4Z2HG74_9TELE|nr:hypothetical protein EYF80_024876 [Liparis tanakae]